jgi:hypothetical protein
MSSIGATATTMPVQPRLSKSSQPKAQSNLTLPTGNSLHLHSPTPSSPSNAPYITAQQYFQRITDLQQMDLQSAIDQMRTLISLYPQRVYKMAYYRKQTKNHWARDDPAFSFLQVLMIIASSIMYGFAFRLSSISAIIGFALKSVLINWLGFGVIVASLGRLIANQHLMTAERSSSHVKQNVEWLYAFDVHCNAFVPLFVILCECKSTFHVRWLIVFMLSMLIHLYDRWSAILPPTNSTGHFTSFTWSVQHALCDCFWLVLLHYSFGIQG